MGFGRELPPAPYTGTWYFYLFHSCQPDGELYLGLGNSLSTKGGIYRTTDYGNTWEQVLAHGDFGGEGHLPLHIMPTSAGYVAAVWHSQASPKYWQLYHALTLAGPWTVVLGEDEEYDAIWRGWPDLWRTDGGDYIWATGHVKSSGNRPHIHLSKDGGLSFETCHNSLTNITWPGQIRVNGDRTRGFFAEATTSQQMRYSANPATIPGTWSTPGIAPRSYSFGVSWPYVVVPWTTQFWFSEDNGETGDLKDIPGDMQTALIDSWRLGIDMSPHDHNLILAAPPSENGGIWRSTDFGDSWVKVLDNLGPLLAVGPPYQNGVMFDLYNPLKAYAWGVEGFFRSDNAGETWQARSNGLEEGQV